MQTKKKHPIINFFTILLTVSIIFTACSNDDNPLAPGGSTAKVAGRISSSNGLEKVMSQSGNNETSFSSIQGAAVVLAQVQADGSLKTVSTQSVQTDASGKFVLETNLHGAENLIVVATQGEAELKAIVSSKVQTGSTVYSPPLTAESTTESNLYIKLVAQGKATLIDATDLKILLNAQGALHIRGNASAEAEFIKALEAQSQTYVSASSNSHFGLTNSQIQAMTNARAEAKANLDAALYNSSDSELETENVINDYDIYVFANSTINSAVYAELVRIGATAFINATVNLSANGRLAVMQSYCKRYAFVLSVAMKQQFQAAGASDTQINAVVSAGTTLYNTLRTSVSYDQMVNAFAQYRLAVKSQLKLVLSSHATSIEAIDTSINGTASAKTILNASIIGSISSDLIINAYVAFFNSVKSTTQAALVGASSAQVNASSQIMILANMN
jgi:hypothetical protein